MSTKEKIIELRNAIRYPRDQVGDKRCWLDYWVGYKLLSDTTPRTLVFPDYEEGMRICTAFYERRKDSQSRIPKIIMPESEWDADLEGISSPTLDITLEELERAWRNHRNKSVDKLTISDDRALYRRLPESGKVPVDFRLPPRNEFLGKAKDYAGCPNFWNSHESCQVAHNPHEWGPCKKLEV